MRALLLLLATGCSPLDDVMDDCGEPVRVTAPRDSLVIFHADDGTPMTQLSMTDNFVELDAPSCHGAVTVIHGREARTQTGVVPGEWLDFVDREVREPTPPSVPAIDQWSMHVDVANAGSREVYAQLYYVLGDELAYANTIPVPFDPILVRGVPIRIVMQIHHDNGVDDDVIDDLPGVQAEVILDAARAPHIEEVAWTREPRRAFTYQLNGHTDVVAGCEIWNELTWCVFADPADVLVMPQLPPGLEPWSPPVVGFRAIATDAGRVIGTSTYTSSRGTYWSATLPIRTLRP